MGRAPSHIIFKRLATKIVKKIIPTGLFDLQEARAKEEMFEQTKGLESIEYKIWSDRVRELSALQPKYANMVKARKYHQKVLHHIAPPPHKVTQKGRFRFQRMYFDEKYFRLIDIDIDSHSD